MTDKELLELAAKAAGYTQKWNEFWRGMYNELPNDCWDSSSYWNPLTIDGDALRLAVKLRLHVDHHQYSGVTAWDMRNGATQFVEDGADEAANTRRAIVRAAAEIGKGME